MDQQDTDRLPEIIDYLRQNPMRTVEQGGTHYHIHMPSPPPPLPPPRPTVAEQVVPWLWTALLACIIATICAAILTVLVLALVIGLLAIAVVVALIAFLIKQMNEGEAVRALARERGKRTR